MVLLSVLYALLTPWLLWRVAGQPTAFVWTTSLLACFYFSVGVLRLSQKMRFFAVFFRVSYVVFLSVSATHFIGPNSGAAVVTLLTFYTAGMFGYAIAEYLQRVGSEEFVSVAVIPPSQSRDLQKGRDEAVCYFCFMHSVISLSLLLRMAWLVLRPASVVFLIAAKNNDNEALLVLKELSLETLSVVWPFCGFVALILQEETIVSLPTMMYKVPACVGLLYTLSTVLSVTVGEVTAVLTLWPIPMAMVGLFGYVIGMFAHYKKIRERNQPLHVSINGLSHSSA
uniref:Uncharacterized protein n=1 Tax=Arundo donax TaxID=35708 RepID=A0A0A9HNA3_ARUDO